MYRAVELHPEDQHLHRFLWRPTPKDRIKEYQMSRMTFGVASSSHLAIRTLQQTAQNHSTSQVASYHVYHSFYVDDLLAGGNSIEEVNALREDQCITLSKGVFKLTSLEAATP